MIKIRDQYYNVTVYDLIVTLQNVLNGKYLQDIKWSSNDIMVTCPFHSDGKEQHPSCGIVTEEDKDTCGIFHCFTCGQSGTLFDFICYCFNNDIEKTLTWLDRNFSTVFVNKDEYLQEIVLDKKVKQNLVDVRELEEYKFFHPYMFKRGLTEDIIRKFGIGCTQDGEYITFPCWDIHNNLIGIYKRATKTKKFIIPKDSPKSIYLLNFVINEGYKKVYVCEGMFDALIMWKYGYPAVALFGAGTSQTQMDILNKTGIREYILMYDNDQAGRHGANRFKNMIRKDVFVTDILMPVGKDCADCTKEEIDNIIRKSLVDF